MIRNKVLVIKLGALGDVALTMLTAKNILTKRGCHITWLTGSLSSKLVSLSSDVDEVIGINYKKLLEGNFLQKTLELLRTWKLLWNKSFDSIYLLHKDPRYKLLTIFSKKKSLHSFSRRDLFPLGDCFHAEQYANVCKATFQYENCLPVLKSFHREKKNNIILLSPGGKITSDGKSNRIWPINNYVLLAEKFLALGFEVCLIGDDTQKYLEESFDHLNIQSMLGRTNIKELLSLLGKAKCLITHDSGVFHIARLVDCPRVCIFGPTNPLNFSSKRFSKELAISAVKEFGCRPCYRGKKYATCSHKECLESIPSDMVFQKVQKFLDGI